ncbi:fibronectin type 3 and ankyrin repeat domains 1 protein isoform X3 [Misgurnus anguillicaudatus]|uniref:fibronectin type 3 and ankyrin repeat domains 1 protein isoform X3 n=1 Tax=Misgurnus anguillicaudatus TaxID=75329 RepID=UPI003CCF7FA9
MKAGSLKLPGPPVVGKVTHHNIELRWAYEDNQPRNGPPEHWTCFSVEQIDAKKHTYKTIYLGYGTRCVVNGLKTSTSHSFRLRITRPSGESLRSPVVSVITTRVPYSGRNLHHALNREDEKELTTVLQSGLVDILVKHGADIGMKYSTGKDSLMMACYAGHLDIVRYLRRCGANWQSRDKNGCSPLHWAVDGEHIPVIKYMIQDGCEVDMRDKISYWTPLMRVSATSGNPEVAAILLQAGAGVNVRDKPGKTPLMVAVLNNHEELVKLLLDSGADHQMKNEYGASAADMAKAFGKENIINLLNKISQTDFN